MSDGPPQHEPLIDNERLVAELRERVERERAAGGYAEDLAALGLEPSSRGLEDAVDADAATEVSAPPAQVVYRPEVGYSSRPVVGPILTAFKRVVYRLFHYPLDDLARQTDDAVRRLATAVAVETATRQATLQEVKDRIDTLVNQLELANRMTAENVAALEQNLGALEEAHERLELPSRLARLERLARGAQPAGSAPAPAAASTASEAPQPLPSFDYMTFENRFRPEKTVLERHGRYLEALRNFHRVVEIGCGRGELLELLRDEDISAYGVEIDPDFVAVCEEKGLEVVQGEGVSHLEALDEGAVDGVVASHVIEHLTSDQLWRLVTASAEKLADGGILILETPNPESLLAGSINFHRDPTHVRPVHPDTLSFLCESAGFREVEILRLEPVPTEIRLPERSGDGDVSPEDHLSNVVSQLNELIYGYQDYALIARA
jgi:O-antigen chain-terminating methyltransferase